MFMQRKSLFFSMKNYIRLLSKNKDQITIPLIQISLIALGGFSQLFYLSNLSSNPYRLYLEEVVLIIGLSNLGSILDLGLFYSSFEKNTQAGIQHKKSRQIIIDDGTIHHAYAVMLIQVCIGFIVALVLNQNLGIFLILYGISIAGTWMVIVARANGLIKSSITIMYIQWPVSLLFEIAYLRSIENSPSVLVLGLAPIAIQIILTFSFGSIVFLKYRIKIVKSEINNLSLYLRRLLMNLSIGLRYLFSFGAIALFLNTDRYILKLLSPDSNVTSYALYATGFSAMTQVIFLNSSLSRRLYLLNANIEKKLSIQSATLTLSLALLFLASADLVLMTFFEGFGKIDFLAAFFALEIFLLGLLLGNCFVQYDPQNLMLRAKMWLIHLLTWLALIYFLNPTFGIYTTIISANITTIFHIAVTRKMYRSK
jgi:hypothetical protein